MSQELMREYISYIENYMRKRLTQEFVWDELFEIVGGIDAVLRDWTGSTYIGHRKEEKIERYFQGFFSTIYKFLIFLNDNQEYLAKQETDLAQKMLFRGIVYRYLGKCDSRNYRKKEIVNPEYNDVYVSWSKNATNAYIESKLYGPMTWMKAEIKEPYYGIDIHGFELWCDKWLGDSSFITRGNECEVVFPTICECVVEIKTL